MPIKFGRGKKPVISPYSGPVIKNTAPEFEGVQFRGGASIDRSVAAASGGRRGMNATARGPRESSTMAEIALSKPVLDEGRVSISNEAHIRNVMAARNRQGMPGRPASTGGYKGRRRPKPVMQDRRAHDIQMEFENDLKDAHLQMRDAHFESTGRPLSLGKSGRNRPRSTGKYAGGNRASIAASEEVVANGKRGIGGRVKSIFKGGREARSASREARTPMVSAGEHARAIGGAVRGRVQGLKAPIVSAGDHAKAIGGAVMGRAQNLRGARVARKASRASHVAPTVSAATHAPHAAGGAAAAAVSHTASQNGERLFKALKNHKGLAVGVGATIGMGLYLKGREKRGTSSGAHGAYRQ